MRKLMFGVSLGASPFKGKRIFHFRQTFALTNARGKESLPYRSVIAF
jgi:hypothetical protein